MIESGVYIMDIMYTLMGCITYFFRQSSWRFGQRREYGVWLAIADYVPEPGHGRGR